MGAALLLPGAAAVLAPSSPPPPVAAVAAEAEPFAASASDPLDISANNSPTVARDPTDPDRVALANRVDLPIFSCQLHVSSDGGATWEPSAIPAPPGTGKKCYAPDVAFGSDGTLYVSYVMLTGLANVPGSVWLASSTDGGRTLDVVGQVGGPLSFQVRLAAHPSAPGRLLMTWLAAEQTAINAFPMPGYPIMAATSTDGGRTWSEPVQVSDPDRLRVLAPAPAVGDDGRLYVAHLDLRDDRLDYHGGHEGRDGPPYPGPWDLVVARSDDGGESWAEATLADDLRPIERFIVFLPASPSIAVGDGRVHVAYHDRRLGDADAWLWTSRDGGASWGPPLRVNDTAEGDGTSQYLPQVDVAPGGRVDVLYYDRRADPADVHNEVSLQTSADGGASFGPRLAVSGGSFDSGIGFGAERGMADLGSRIALSSTDEVVLAAWADTRLGTVHSGEQDIYRALLTVAAPGAGGRQALRWGGAAVAAAGLVVLATALRRPTSGAPPRPSGRRPAGSSRR